MAKRYYLTTPIYYVNSTPHAGHALTMLICDVTKRHRRMRGEEVVFLTGTDENGQKIKEAAEKAGEDPMAFVDRISQTFADCARSLNIDYDIFMRTTSEPHRRASQALFNLLREKGHIYEGTYEGWYDVSSETFVRESDLVDGKSPDGNPVQWVSEQNWFFRLSAFEQPLLDYIAKHPDFLLPEGRRNEVISFIRQGLRDMCITRENQGWGIEVPGDPSKVIYVWFEALINYLAATGWPEPGWEELWPADVHWMAKEIFVRFHATLWPAMLMAAALPLPKTVIAHGWFVFGDAKMSKSLGNVVSPEELVARFTKAGCTPDLAVDAARWALIRAVPYESDTNFTHAEIARTYNADLANDLGNALNRSLAMAHKFVSGVMPAAEIEPEAAAAIEQAKIDVIDAFDHHRLDHATEAAIGLVRFLNKYIDQRAPWTLHKQGDPALGAVIASMLLVLRAVEGLVRPFTPAAADAMAAQLGVVPLTSLEPIGTPSSLPAGTRLGQPAPMFPRLDLTKADETMETPAEPAPKKEKPKRGLPEPADEITIEEFLRLNLRVGRVIEAQRVEGSEKLMKLQVRVGEEQRQIVAGIAQQYAPEDLIGRQVCVVFNLKPAKLMGLESQGMIMAADDPSGGAILLEPDKEAPEGSRIH